MHFSITSPSMGSQDLWAEPGSTWGQILDQVAPSDRAQRWFVGPTPIKLDQVAGQNPLLPGCLVCTTPTSDQTPASGAWRLVGLGGPAAGQVRRLWSGPANAAGPDPARFTPAKGGWRLQRLTAGPVWLGTVRQRRGAFKVRWRRVGSRPTTASRGCLIRTNEQTWVLDRPVNAQSSQDSTTPPARRWGALLGPVAVAVAMGGLMLALTSNPMWAAMPLVGALSAVITAVARRPRRGGSWLDQVQGLGGNALQAPSADMDIHGPPAAVQAASRAWAASRPALHTPNHPDWAWARFSSVPAQRSTQAVVIVQSGHHLTWRTLDTTRQSPPTELPGQVADQGPKRSGQALGLGASTHQTNAVTGVATWRQPNAPDQPHHVAVRPAGLGLLAVRVNGAAPYLMLGLSRPTALQLNRLATARQPPAPGPSQVGPAEPSQVLQNWALDRPVFPVGQTSQGDCLELDLVQMGPHLVVAGATGSGKSEFLRTVILGAASAMSPSRLAIVGIDHKGGASFADLGGLPHLAGVATDLDAATSHRALTSLEAELRRREQLVQSHGLAKLTDLPDAVRPPRLMVVVDEFRTLLDWVPAAGAALERLAAQGRSLEMFLVLATQRPAGAVSPQLRSNLPLRVCFRVATEADSIDMLSTTAAMDLDPQAPGSAVMASAGCDPVRLMADLAGSGGPRPAKLLSWPENWSAPPVPTGRGVDTLVATLAKAAQLAGAPAAQAPWAPPLPQVVERADLADWPVAVGPDQPDQLGVAVGLADLPDQQRLGGLVVGPSHGHLAVLGAPRSGRTTTALTITAASVGAGWPTHVLTQNQAVFHGLRHNPWLGSVLEPTAAGLSAWLDSLSGQASAGPQVVVVDHAELLAEVIPPGQDRPALEVLAGMGPAWWVVITASARPARYLSHFPQRLVLPTMDLAEDLALGLDRQMAGGRSQPGRALYTRPGISVAVQVAMPSLGSQGEVAPPVCPPPRVMPLPPRVAPSDLPPPNAQRLWWGLGGRLALPVALDLVPGQAVAVVGPPGSGRSTVLAALADQAQAAGLEVLSDLPSDPWPTITEGLNRGALVLADNLDQATGAPGVLPRQGHLVAALTATTSPSFHGPASLFHGAANALVLWPRGVGSGAVLGLNLPATGENERQPGRGVVVRGGRITPVQAASY